MLDDGMMLTVAFAGLANLCVWLVIAGYSFFKLWLPIYHPFSLMLFYHLVGFVMRPYYIAQNSGSFMWNRIGFSPDVSDILLTSCVANVALCSTYLGFVAAARTIGGRIPKPTPYHIEIGRPLHFKALLVLFVAMGLYANYRMFGQLGLDSVMAIKTEYDSMVGQRLVGVSGYTLAMAEFLPSILVLLVMIPKMRRIALILIAAYILLRLLAGAQRLSFVVVIVGVGFYFLIEARRRFPSIKLMVFLVIFAYLFNIVGGDRYAMRRLFMGTASIGDIISSYQERRGGEGITNDAVEFDVSTAALSAVTRNGAYTYGTQYLRLLIWPIPRQLWAEKPVFTSIVNLNDYGDFRYLTIGVYADTFMAFSFASLIVMMMGLGMFFARIYEAILKSYNVIYVMFFWVVLIYAKTILRDGGVTIVYFWGFSMIPIFILSYAGRLRLCRREISQT